jgi:hypothetical protein
MQPRVRDGNQKGYFFKVEIEKAFVVERCFFFPAESPPYAVALNLLVENSNQLVI